VWQFPHFWAIAWVLDDDYKKAGFRLLPTTKRDRPSALLTLLSTILLVPVSLLPTFMGFGGYVIGAVSLLLGLIFCWFALNLYRKLDIESARKVMFGSFFYLPIVQVVLLFDFIPI
jgi:protoheme IX farnesyltransferase